MSDGAVCKCGWSRPTVGLFDANQGGMVSGPGFVCVTVCPTCGTPSMQGEPKNKRAHDRIHEAIRQLVANAAVMIAALFALVGCGSPFETQAHDGAPVEAQAEGGAPPDVRAAHVDAGHHRDGGGGEAAPSVEDVLSTEAGVDALEADAPSSDARDEVEACAYPPAAPAICDGIPAGGVAYCIEIGVGEFAQGTTPLACRCAANYACSCILAQPDPCDGRGKVAGCMLSAGVPVVECT